MKFLRFWLACSLCFFNLARAAELPDFSMVTRWRGEYQSTEFAPLHDLLIYPTQSPDLVQSTNSVKPTKYERQVLAIWTKVFDDHLIGLIRQSAPPAEVLYREYRNKVDKVYALLIANSVNYGWANTELAKLTIEVEQKFAIASAQQVIREDKEKEARQNKLTAQALDGDQKRKTQSECSTKKTQFDAMQLEQDTWHDMTAALNQSFKDPQERAKMEQTQKLQALQTNQKIIELGEFIHRNCKL